MQKSKRDKIKDPTGLIKMLDDLLATGAQNPDDLVTGSPALIDRVCPGADHDLYQRARIAQRVLVASIAALGRPRADALRVLYNLNPVPRNQQPLLTKTERRERAAKYYRLEGETVRRHTEEKLLTALAVELDYRILRSLGSTRHVNYAAILKLPHQLPPPPAEFYQQAARQRRLTARSGSRNPAYNPTKRPWVQK